MELLSNSALMAAVLSELGIWVFRVQDFGFGANDLRVGLKVLGLGVRAEAMGVEFKTPSIG